MKKVYVIEYRGHEPNFNGKANLSKCKAWLTMYDRSVADKKPLTTLQLWWETGVPYHSLSKLISLWWHWHYVERIHDAWPMKVRLAARGRDWVRRWYDIMPIERITSEIEEWQRIRPPFPKRKRDKIAL